MDLKFGWFRIRNWKEYDIASLAGHANNYKIWLNLRDSFPYPYTIDHAREWVTIASVPPVMHFAIEVNGAAVGGIGFNQNDDIHRRSVEIGYWLGEDFWGRGIMSEAVKAVTGYAFINWDITRIYAGVFEWNPASMRVLEKAGYKLDGILRKNVTKDGKIIDEHVYSFIR